VNHQLPEVGDGSRVVGQGCVAIGGGQASDTFGNPGQNR
jgi:hypothetical protein